MGKGKYAGIIDSLPKYNGNDPAYQDKVNAVKSSILQEDPKNRRASVLAQKYADVRLEEDVYEDLLKEVRLRKEAISQLLVESFEVEVITSLNLITGPTIRVQSEPHVQVLERELCRLWCIRAGLERELQLPWQTLNKHTKDLLLAGEPEPDGTVAWAKSKIVLTKG